MFILSIYLSMEQETEHVSIIESQDIYNTRIINNFL